MDFDKHGGWNKRGGWNKFMKSINVQGGFFCEGWNFSKSVSVGSSFIREMIVGKLKMLNNVFQKRFQKYLPCAIILIWEVPRETSLACLISDAL